MSILEFFTISFVQFSTSSNFDTSITFEVKFVLLSSLTDFFSVSGSLSQIITLSPELRNLLAISNPNPWAPPVITAVLFSKLNVIYPSSYFFAKNNKL